MAGRASDMLAVARRNLGITEGPRNWNPYASIAGHANNQAWCATFLVAIGRKAGVKIGNESAYTPSLADSLTPVSQKNVKPGDVMFLYFTSLGRIAHCGVVEAVAASYVITIEGNTDVVGGRTGGRVMRKKRAYKNLSFGRPNYKPESAPKPPPAKRPADPILRIGNRGQKVLDVQNALIKAGYRIARDGDFGEATRRAVIAFQKKSGISADGVVGPATWAALRKVVHG